MAVTQLQPQAASEKQIPRNQAVVRICWRAYHHNAEAETLAAAGSASSSSGSPRLFATRTGLAPTRAIRLAAGICVSTYPGVNAASTAAVTTIRTAHTLHQTSACTSARGAHCQLTTLGVCDSELLDEERHKEGQGEPHEQVDEVLAADEGVGDEALRPGGGLQPALPLELVHMKKEICAV